MALTEKRITRDDLEAAFNRFMGDTEESAKAQVPKALVIAGAVALVVIAIAYISGKRGGRKKSAQIEIIKI